MKLPESKEETIDFMNRCSERINITLDVDLKLRDKYKKIYELTKDKAQKEEIKKKMEENDKEIEYFKWSLDCMNKRLKQYEEEDKKEA